jgi:hypothetical protein
MDSKISKLFNIKRYLNKTLFKTPGVEYLIKNHSFVEKKKRHINFWLNKACKNKGLKRFFFEKSNRKLSENLSNYKFNANNKFTITSEMFDVLSSSGLLIVEDALPPKEKNEVINLFSELKNKNYSNQWKEQPKNILRDQTDLNIGMLEISKLSYLKNYSDQFTKKIFNKIVEPNVQLHYLKLKNFSSENRSLKGETFLHSDRFLPHFKMFYTPFKISEDEAPFQYALGSHKITDDYLDFFLNAKSFDETDFQSKKFLNKIVNVVTNENTLYIAFTNGLHRRTPFQKISERNMVFFQYVERFNKLNYLF